MLNLRIVLITAWALLLTVPAAAAPPVVEGCEIFPADNHWNLDISAAAVHPDSANIIDAIQNDIPGGNNLHPDFGGEVDDWYGIPWIAVSGTQRKVPVSFLYDDESDPGPYPIPPNAPIEGGGAAGDRHVLVIDRDNCVLYETFASEYVGGSQQAWAADSGAIWNLDSNALRPDTWTSADAAGLPIFPGLARCEEANTGTISHALRVTFSRTQASYIYPATHEASSYEPGAYPYYPPMGLRLRLRASYSEAGFTGQALAIVQAMKTYGLIVADNGSNWFFSGEYNPNCWDDDELNDLKTIAGDNFEVIVSPAPATVTYNAPSLSTPANAEMLNNAQPALLWNTVTGATGYEVAFGDSTEPEEIVAEVDRSQRTEFIPDEPLLAAKPYFWRVRAITPGDVPTAWSETRVFGIASPLNAAPIIHLTDDETPTLTWGRVEWATGYTVQISKRTNFPATSDTETLPLGDVLTVTLPTLVDGVYYWRVCARNVANVCGAWSVVSPLAVDG